MRSLPLMCLLLTACPPSIRRPESSQVVMTGTLYAGGYERRGEPLTDARVTIRRADTGEELASNSTSSGGGYRLAASVPANTRVVLIAESTGFAPIARAFTVGPFTELTISSVLTPLDTLECVDALCGAPLSDLEWSEPPQGATGTAATFEQESPLSVGNDRVLALTYVHLEGGTTGTLHLRVPLANWASLIDAVPGNGVLEVPVSRFDVKTAQWTKLTAAPLVSESGLPIPESALGALQRAEFAGGAVAVLPVSTDVFLAVLGAPEPLGCVTGTLVAEGKAAEGATISFRGLEPRAASAEGAFCATSRVGGDRAPTRGQYGGLPYALTALTPATASGTCGGTCTAVGTVNVLPDALQLTELCKFTGKVIDSRGNPVENAEVVAFDESIAGNSVTAFCGKTGTQCNLAAPSGTDGTFTLKAPLLSSLFVGARATSTSASQAFTTCPTEPLTLKLQHGAERIDVTATFTGNQLAWQPPRAAARVTVLDANGLPKWEVVAPGGLLPPLNFATVPLDATENVAPTGIPASGDNVVVEFQGVGRDGVVYLGTGTGTRP